MSIDRASTIKTLAYLVNQGGHKDLEGAAPEPGGGDGAVSDGLAPLNLGEDDDEEEEEAVEADSEAWQGPGLRVY